MQTNKSASPGRAHSPSAAAAAGATLAGLAVPAGAAATPPAPNAAVARSPMGEKRRSAIQLRLAAGLARHGSMPSMPAGWQPAGQQA